MTPKGKAAQLRYKYSTLLDLKTTDGLVLQCALIAVDEQINECLDGFSYTDYRRNFWQEVKEELELL